MPADRSAVVTCLVITALALAALLTAGVPGILTVVTLAAAALLVRLTPRPRPALARVRSARR